MNLAQQLRHLRRANEVARAAMAAGHHPFGALLVAPDGETVLMEQAKQRNAAKERFQNFQALPPQQRQQVRERLQAFKELPPEEQARIRDGYQHFNALPPAERQKLRQQWQQMPQQQKNAIRQQHQAHLPPRR